MKLFESGQIGNMKLNNRVFMAPMGSSMEDLDGGMSPQAVAYFAERAQGGCGLIMVSACVSKELEGRLLFCLDSDAYRNRFETFVSEMHALGAKVWHSAPGRLWACWRHATGYLFAHLSF